jgi:hypothetical protein
VNRGLDLIRYRLGHIGREGLPDDVLDGLAQTWMEKTLPQWFYTGELDEWGRDLEYVYLVRSGDWSEDGLRELVERFGDWEAFGEAMLRQARRANGELAAANTHLAWPAAGSEELVELWSRTTFDDPSGALKVLLDEREDSVAELEAMSRQFEESGEPEKAEFAAVAAILRAEAEQQPIPDGLESRVDLALLDQDPWPAHHPAAGHFLRALAALPSDRGRAWFESRFERAEISKGLLYAISPIGRHIRLDDKLFDVIDGWEETGEDALAFLESFAMGMSGVGPRALKWLDTSLTKTDSALAKDAFRLAAIHIIADHARHNVEWPADHDHFLSYTDWNHELLTDSLEDWVRADESADMWFDKLVREHLDLSVAALPAERAEAVTIGQIESDSAMWERALGVLPRLPQPIAARAIGRATERMGVATTVLYFAETTDEPADGDDLNRIGGRPPAIDDWPSVGHDAPFGPAEDEEPWPMEHIFTLDLAEAPELRGEIDGQPRAFCFFALDPEEFEDGERTAVVFLDEEVASSGEFSGELPAGDEASPLGFRVEAFIAPEEIFSEEAARRPEQLDPALGALREAVYLLNARLGGGPIWLQDAPYGFDEADPGMFLMQFDAGFVPRDMLDIFGSGVMYLFERFVEAQA